MRSIFGRCIAIAMMAAIAVAWHSPPVQAQTAEEMAADRKEKAEDATAAARAHAIAASNAVDDAKDAAEDAEGYAERAELAAKEAEDARDAIEAADGAAADFRAARNAARDARDAATAAREKSGAEEGLAADDDIGRPVVTESPSNDGSAWGQYRQAVIEAGLETISDDVTDDETTSAWNRYRAAKLLSDEDVSVQNLEDTETARNNAETARKNAEGDRDTAVENATFAKVRAEFAERRSAANADLAGIAAAAAVTAAEAAVAEAQAKADADPNLVNLDALEEAQDDLETAQDRADDYPTMMAGDDDDDDTMAGDDDDDDTMAGDDDDDDMMADMGMQVAPNGVGDLLLFGYWTTQEGRGTLVALTNTGNMMTNVHVRVREGAGSQDVGDFTVCMGAGDVWTAAITSDGTISRLMVGSAGSCGTDPVPADGMIINAAAGYLEAFTIDAMDGGADSLTGTATIVSVMDGFASSYNATALVGLDGMNTSAPTSGHEVKYALAREGGVDKEVLLGRWTATTSMTSAVDSLTQVVLTFPGAGQPGKDDAITAHVFNEDGNSNNSPRSLMLNQEVNVCTFWNANFTMNDRVAFECNGGDKLLVAFDEGWFRLVNNAVGAEMDAVDSMPAKRFAAIGLQFSAFMGDSGSFDQSYPIQWMAYSGAGGMGAAPWYYMMDGEMMMIDPGDNTTGSVEMMGMDESEME